MNTSHHVLARSGLLHSGLLHSGLHSGFVGPVGHVLPPVHPAPYLDVNTTLTAQNADLTANLHGSNVELSACQARCA